jgi:uncharacterized protein
MRLVRLRLDPWPADYEGPFQLEEFEEGSGGQIDPDVEGIAWSPIQPKRIERPEPLFFVDGVRRIDARIIADDDSGRIVHGLFGSVACGAVRVERSKAAFEDIRIRRYIVLGSGLMAEPEEMTAGNSKLTFVPCSVAETGPTAPLLGMQNLMRTEEAAIAQEYAQEAACVFADGPLTYFAAVKQRTVGVIKRLFKAYLPASNFALVPRLALAERTPLFAIIDGKYDRFSWYLRIGMPRPMDHDVAGVLRMEVRSGVGLQTAVELADLSASCIPAFAGDSARDPRAPQNLLPIGALEQELKHRLGDAIAIRRAIERVLFARAFEKEVEA